MRAQTIRRLRDAWRRRFDDDWSAAHQLIDEALDSFGEARKYALVVGHTHLPLIMRKLGVEYGDTLRFEGAPGYVTYWTLSEQTRRDAEDSKDETLAVSHLQEARHRLQKQPDKEGVRTLGEEFYRRWLESPMLQAADFYAREMVGEIDENMVETIANLAGLVASRTALRRGQRLANGLRESQPGIADGRVALRLELLAAVFVALRTKAPTTVGELTNVSTNYIAGPERKTEKELYAGPVTESVRPRDEEDFAAREVAKIAIRDRIKGSGLSPREREAILLRLDDLTYKQIAERMGNKVGTVRSLLSRARSKAGLEESASHL